MLALHNFGAEAVMVSVALDDLGPGCSLVDLLDGLSEHPIETQGSVELHLEAYGYRWLRLRRPDDDPII